MNAGELITALRERGLVAADAPPPPDESERPWYLWLLMAIAGWAAGLMVMLFLGAAFDISSMREVLVIGLALLVVAWALYAASREFVIVEQLALALSIAGQIAVTAWLFDKLQHALPIAAAMLGLQLLLFVVMRDRTARTLAAAFAGTAWVLLVRVWLRQEAGSLFFDSHGKFQYPLFGAWTAPIQWLITWAPLIGLVVWLRLIEPRWLGRAAADLARPGLTGLLLVLAIGGIASEPPYFLDVGFDLPARDFSFWALFPLLSIGLALFAAYSAFALRSGGLSGVAIVAALAHLARFYYLYGTTLTVKSAIMAVVGILLLGASWLVAGRSRMRS